MSRYAEDRKAFGQSLLNFGQARCARAGGWGSVRTRLAPSFARTPPQPQAHAPPNSGRARGARRARAVTHRARRACSAHARSRAIEARPLLHLGRAAR